MQRATNHVDHIVLILDASGSMSKHKSTLIDVVDNKIIRDFADKYKQTEQETRISVFAFSGRYEFECLIYDTDVLRVPGINSLYETYNMTALIDASIKTIDDLLAVPTKYGDHAFLVYLLTDGLENHSSGRPNDLASKLSNLPDNWTFAGFVPDKTAKSQLANCGVPLGNIAVWNTVDAAGALEVGTIIQTTTEQFKQNRKAGIRGSKSLFQMNVVSGSDILSKLEPLPQFKYQLVTVPADIRIDDFTYDRLGTRYRVGSGYYQLTKKETIQPAKKIAILYKGKVYVGEARQLLGLPDDYVDVKPDAYADYTIFVQSTAINRKLLANTNYLHIPQ